MPEKNPDNTKTIRELVKETGDFKLRGKIKAEAVLKEKEKIKNNGNRIQRTQNGHTYQIKIHDVKTAEVGGNTCVEVYAQAWKDGKQMGFGKDGTVDIERFRIINPPILVPDENGDILRTTTNQDTGALHHRRFREDPQEALLQVIEHNLLVMRNIHTSKKIVRGKRGNTTTTVFPDADPESTSVDGNVVNEEPNETGGWAAARDAATGDAASSSDTSGVIRASVGVFYVVNRVFTLFDTSSIGSDTIDSATVSLYRDDSNIAFANDETTDIDCVSSSPASNTDITTADFDQVGSTVFGSFAMASTTVNTYFDITLDANGIANIDGSGVSKFGFRNSRDTDNAQPTGQNRISVSMADTGGTTQDPKLVVEHTPSSTQYEQAVTATAQANASVVHPSSRLRTLAVTANATALMIKQVGRTISITAQATASFLKQLPKTLQVTAQATPLLTAGLLYVKELAVTAQATASIVKNQVTIVVLTVTAEATATFTQIRSFLKTITTTAQASATISRLKTLSQVLTATAQATASVVNTGLTLSRELVVTASATVTVTFQKALSKAITATASAVVSLLKDFGYIDKYPTNEVNYQDKYPEE